MTLKNKIEVQHFKETERQPVHCRVRPIHPHRYEKVGKEFQNMIEQGFCKPSKSPWSSPLHSVPKKKGDIRTSTAPYQQVNVREEDVEKTTPVGLFEFSRMCPDLKKGRPDIPTVHTPSANCTRLRFLIHRRRPDCISSIPSAPLQCQETAIRRGIRQPFNEVKRRRGYLNYDACMRFAMRPALTTDAEIIKNNRNN
ncbi:hypothetical protein EVAR_21584_1 [Eumeta japonica]|uniref:Uncharacterized protein n=1 Tax=Eumeta variegata TaxID=151549 RepID=A0A4C1UYP3_EUMVA|nr:hypothetical protein EVAR_21584_1 [Eumeta japonica]